MGKEGETRATMQRRAPLPTQAELKGEILGGRYKVVYDGKGLQRAGATNSNPDCTWYNFLVYSSADKEIGHYHVHPRSSGKGYASGNLSVNTSGAFGSAIIPQARDWQWLCDKVVSQIG